MTDPSAGPAGHRVLIILHQSSSDPGHVGRWLTRNGYALDIRRPRYGDALPRTLAAHAGAIIFGGPMSANDGDDFIRVETEWIGVALREGKPFLGICLGAQMLARHLGAKVEKHPGGKVEIGYHPLRATQAGQRLCCWPEEAYQWHNEGFALPAGAIPLARADGPFEHQAFAYGPAAFGVQFHPEITRLLVHRWTAVPARLAFDGAQEADEQIRAHIRHSPAVHRWLDGFMRGWLGREHHGNASNSHRLG